MFAILCYPLLRVWLVVTASRWGWCPTGGVTGSLPVAPQRFPRVASSGWAPPRGAPRAAGSRELLAGHVPRLPGRRSGRTAWPSAPPGPPVPGLRPGRRTRTAGTDRGGRCRPASSSGTRPRPAPAGPPRRRTMATRSRSRPLQLLTLGLGRRLDVGVLEGRLVVHEHLGQVLLRLRGLDGVQHVLELVGDLVRLLVGRRSGLTPLPSAA